MINCLEEGKYALQDFDTDVSIKFDKRELGKISEIHNDIFVKERTKGYK